MLSFMIFMKRMESIQKETKLHLNGASHQFGHNLCDKI
ncbi:hypothetical protein SPRA44_370032 [Serratia proteamaculans]|nr:hypothetical protein SPRA44_370032 [Serratia proteamaculans]